MLRCSTAVPLPCLLQSICFGVSVSSNSFSKSKPDGARITQMTRYLKILSQVFFPFTISELVLNQISTLYVLYFYLLLLNLL